MPTTAHIKHARRTTIVLLGLVAAICLLSSPPAEAGFGHLRLARLDSAKTCSTKPTLRRFKSHRSRHASVRRRTSERWWKGTCSTDTTAPQTTISSAPPATTTATSASFSFESSESGSSFECKLDETAWASCTSPKAYSGLALGSHLFSVRARDAAGNLDQSPASDGWTVESPPVTPPSPQPEPSPETSIETSALWSAPTGAEVGVPLTLDGSASTGAAPLRCVWSFESQDGSTIWETHEGCLLGFTFQYPGMKYVKLTVSSAGGTSDSLRRSFEVGPAEPPPDTTAPQTTISSAPPATTTATSASFSFESSESGSSFECKLDETAWASCTSPKAYSGLALGSHLFSVRARDAAGNLDQSPASDGWTVESPSPAPPSEPSPPPSECTTVVSSLSAARSGVSAASPGDVVCLADGTYGELVLNASKSAPGVTLRAEHPGQATLGPVKLEGSHLTLARFDVDGQVNIQPGTSGMRIEHNRITGGYFGVDACPSTTTTCDDMAIVGNQFVGPYGEDAIHLNRYHDANGDGVGVLVEGNSFTKIREDGNHSDCLQTVWVGDHLVYRRNYLHDNRCQGFFVKDQDSLTGGVTGSITGIVVEDNLFLRNQEPCEATDPGCGQPHIFQVFGPYTGFVMRHNTIWGDGSVSGAYFREGVAPGTLIESNVVYRFWTDTDASGATFANNTLCDIEASGGGSWPSSRPGTTVACSLPFQNPSVDDYRLGNGRGVDWAPAEEHYGP